MKRPLTKLSEAEVLRDFPTIGQVLGWFFRTEEGSNGVYLVKGTDLWGRQVARTGADPVALLSGCEADAQRIERQLQEPES